ncbi:MAG: hypothetical protein HY014_12430 [Acidobacteria bacterium]|nr:hypothetical protein [Acidobacteriota bacterium]
MLHDWGETWERFGGQPGQPITLAGFMQQMARRNRTGLDLKKLCDWMILHPDTKIITDVKTQNISALSLILNRIPKARQRVIPQAYSFDEWDALVGMGFDRVLLTVYRRAQRSFMLRTFITKRHPWGLTLPKDRASHDSIVQFARDHGVYVFAHTVNTHTEAQNLIKSGVSEIYTDFLLPIDESESTP